MEGVVRLFADTQNNEKGIKALDMQVYGKRHPVKAFFLTLFGTKIELGGKTYVIGRQSATNFLVRQEQSNFGGNLVAALEKYYMNSKVQGQTKIAFYSGNKIEIPRMQLIKALQAIGIKNPSFLLNDLGVGSIVHTTREALFDALIKHAVTIDSGSVEPEFQNFAIWLKQSIDTHKVTPQTEVEVEHFVEEEIETPVPSPGTSSEELLFLTNGEELLIEEKASESIPENTPDPVAEPVSLVLKSDSDILQAMKAVKNKQTAEFKILKNRLNEIVKNFSLENNQIELQVSLIVKMYCIIKNSYSQVVKSPKTAILQRTDQFVCLDDENIKKLQKDKKDKGLPFSMDTIWGNLLWLACANQVSTPIPGLMLSVNMFDLEPKDWAKLCKQALTVAQQP